MPRAKPVPAAPAEAGQSAAAAGEADFSQGAGLAKRRLLTALKEPPYSMRVTAVPAASPRGLAPTPLSWVHTTRWI